MYDANEKCEKCETGTVIGIFMETCDNPECEDYRRAVAEGKCRKCGVVRAYCCC